MFSFVVLPCFDLGLTVPMEYYIKRREVAKILERRSRTTRFTFLSYEMYYHRRCFFCVDFIYANYVRERKFA